MLRLPTLVNFPRLLSRYYQVPDDEESTALLTPETKKISVKHRITSPSITNDTCFIYPNTIDQKNLWINHKVQQELLALSKFAIPLVITFMVAVGMRVVDVWFLGKLGPQAMAVVSLGGLFTTITGLSIGQGILTGM
jgi:hypothetical protein